MTPQHAEEYGIQQARSAVWTSLFGTQWYMRTPGNEYPREKILNWPPSKGNALMSMSQIVPSVRTMLQVWNRLNHVIMAEMEIELAGVAT